MVHIIASAASSNSKVPWYEIATGIIAIPAALLTIYGSVALSRKTRLESRKLEIEIAAAEGKEVDTSKPRLPLTAPDRSSRLIVVSIEGYVIRFILLYLTYEIVRFLLNAIEPLFNYPLFFRPTSTTEAFFFTISGSYINLVVNVFVFLLLGLPLFRDILASLGLRPREIFSKELRKRVQSKSTDGDEA